MFKCMTTHSLAKLFFDVFLTDTQTHTQNRETEQKALVDVSSTHSFGLPWFDHQCRTLIRDA